MIECLENYGNPSSIHTLGQQSKRLIETSRKQVAKAINAKANEIYFTSGGTESNNLAIIGFCYANKDKGKHIITSVIEHPSVLESMKYLEQNGFDVTYINVDKYGIINLNELEKSIRKDTILISIMFANNEIGTISPINEIGKITKLNHICFHTDAVQAIGSVDIDVEKLNIDMMSMSGHKVYATKGVGALYLKDGVISKAM